MIKAEECDPAIVSRAGKALQGIRARTGLRLFLNHPICGAGRELMSISERFRRWRQRACPPEGTPPSSESVSPRSFDGLRSA